MWIREAGALKQSTSADAHTALWKPTCYSTPFESAHTQQSANE